MTPHRRPPEVAGIGFKGLSSLPPSCFIPSCSSRSGCRHPRRTKADVGVVSNVPFGAGFLRLPPPKIDTFSPKASKPLSLCQTQNVSPSSAWSILSVPEYSFSRRTRNTGRPRSNRSCHCRLYRPRNFWIIPIKQPNSATPVTFGPRYPQTAGSIRSLFRFFRRHRSKMRSGACSISTACR